MPANLCFGGRDGANLFITACTAVYTLPVLARGVRRFYVDEEEIVVVPVCLQGLELSGDAFAFLE